MDVREMDLPARAKMCLIKAGYYSLDDLYGINREEIASIKNLNYELADKILECIDKYNSKNSQTKDLNSMMLDNNNDIFVRFNDIFSRDEKENPYVIYTELERTLISRFFDDNIGYDSEDFFREDDALNIYEIISELKKKENKISQIYGTDCAVFQSRIKLFKGTFIECICESIRWFKKNRNSKYCDIELRYKDNRSYYRTIKEMVDKINIRINSLPDPFDEAVIPQQYTRFYTNEVDENNFKELWIELKKIEQKYQQSIDYQSKNRTKEWEAALCYEQGKYIELIEWTGSKISDPVDISINHITYRKMDENQLKYYLYWRTNFNNGKYISTGRKSYYYLLAYELLAEFGLYSPEARLKQLEYLYTNYSVYGLPKKWVREYADFHHLEINDYFKASYQNNNETIMVNQGGQAWKYAFELYSGDFTNIFEIMCYKSPWKVKKNTFVVKSGCLDYIRGAVEASISKLILLFKNNNLEFADFITGGIKKSISKKSMYADSIWDQSMLTRLGYPELTEEKYDFAYLNSAIYITDESGNIQRETTTRLTSEDSYLSEYILKFIEMKFRHYFEYEFISWPTELKGAIRYKFSQGKDFFLSTDVNEREKQLKYCSLYPEIKKILETEVNVFFVKHEEQLVQLKMNFHAGKPKLNSVSSEKIKRPGLEEVSETISKATYFTKTSEILELMERMSPSIIKSKAKILSKYIFDFWILHEGDSFSYTELMERLPATVKFYEHKMAIINGDYLNALSYLYRAWNPTTGAMGKYYSKELIQNCVLVTLYALDELFYKCNYDLCEAFLGTWSKRVWKPFDNTISIQSSNIPMFLFNIANVEGYSKEEGILYVEGYEDSDADLFITYVLKQVDNELRKRVNYKLLSSGNIYDIIKDKLWKGIHKYIDSLIEMSVELILKDQVETNILTSDRKYIVNTSLSYARKKESTFDLFSSDVDIVSVVENAFGKVTGKPSATGN